MLVIALVAIGYQPPRRTDAQPVANAISTPNSAVTQPSVDQVLATNIAAGMAAQANLPVAANIANTSLSLAAQSQLDQSNANVIAKPQIVQPNATSRGLRTYKAVAGDTVDSVAAQFDVTSQTVRWANNLVSDALTPGQNLQIPSTNGVVYTVKGGDTPDSIASTYKVNPEVVVAYNDLEGLSSLPNGKQIIIPGGQLPADQQPGYVAPTQNSYTASGTNYYGNASSISSAMASASAGNQYAFGNCTWYAYNRRAELGRPIGSYWGNAATWAMYARSAGFAVDGVPAVGAIQQNGGGYGGYGHVAIVEQVVQGQYVRISEMNAYRAGGGFNRVDFYNMPWSEAVSGQYNYIH